MNLFDETQNCWDRFEDNDEQSVAEIEQDYRGVAVEYKTKLAFKDVEVESKCDEEVWAYIDGVILMMEKKATVSASSYFF